MDFILSLTHFCEVHGPTSIICSQVLPFSCSQCCSRNAEVSSDETPATSHDTGYSNAPPPPEICRKPSPHSKRTESPTGGPYLKIEDHPNFLKPQQLPADADRLNRFGGGEGDTCASCSLTLPEDVRKKLPPGAPGTLKGDGTGRNGSPVLRSREVVFSCGTSHSDTDDSAQDSRIHLSLPDSLQSSSIASDSSCHTHILTYISLRGPPNPSDYALLRRSSIRTLSCELLPRGLSSGPLCFGDSIAGYTIAYIFRLPDPMARGKRRSYALVALAGKDAGRSFRACPVIWRAFGRIASGIVSAAENFQEEEKRRAEQNNVQNKIVGRTFTPVSSFLTGRTMDPDGHPRRPGPIRARNLAEIVGNQYIFAELHANFVALLQQLGSMFGGIPQFEEPFLCSTVSDEANLAARTASSAGGREKFKHNATETYDAGDLVVPSLSLSSSTPKPIPIAPRRRQVVA